MHDKPLAAALVWLRRDLRVHDNAALHHALHAARRVWCAFVFDRTILDPLPRVDRRVQFIRDSVAELDATLLRTAQQAGSPGTRLLVRHGDAAREIVKLADALGVQAVFASHDDDPYALQRDGQVRGALAERGVALHTSKDHVVFERTDVLNAARLPYVVFTPYKNAWLRQLDERALAEHPVTGLAAALAPVPDAIDAAPPTLQALGFLPTNLQHLRLPTGESGAETMWADFIERIDDYARARDYPALKGPSYLGTHLRFGTLSIRRMVRAAWQRTQVGSVGAQAWLSELIWREFFHQVLHHHPHVVGHAFRREYDAVHWEHGKKADAHFAAWCEGRTGYPLVDAAMQQINSTGYMHNRLRMVTASFLTKHLGIDWRRGEAYFAEKLNDFDLASNNGGWQWAASTGCDAQPYFRIFNPVTQSQKFDPQGAFIRRYLPALSKLPDALLHAPWRARPVDLQAADLVLGRDYPLPIVQHEAARTAALARYAAVKARG
ncbi:MAG: deoxyribodipyrimidine photo-lyase [Burkholderiaceae bacterium]|nr:deoxyribodipyrimidine photo-lyase [Burkholderiaceae bacterium]